MALLLLMILSALPALAGVSVPGAKVIGASLPQRWCAEGWDRRREGGCWVPVDHLPGESKVKAYVHPAGWIVDPRCLDDRRFDPGEFLAALDEAAKKLDPELAASAGGCLGTFNPAMARQAREAVWSSPTYISCGPWEPGSTKCADESRSGEANLIQLRNIVPCLGADGTGLAGTLFHETLHAAGIDNWTTEKHNSVASLPQFEFVHDRVYGAEATCFYGTAPARRKKANFMQCLETIRYDVVRPDRALCEGFNHDYYDTTPPYTK